MLAEKAGCVGTRACVQVKAVAIYVNFNKLITMILRLLHHGQATLLIYEAPRCEIAKHTEMKNKPKEEKK